MRTRVSALQEKMITITGTAKHEDGSGWANARVEIRLEGYPSQRVTAVGDADGAFSIEVETTAADVIPAIAKLPDGAEFQFTLDPEAETIDIGDLKSNGGDPAPELTAAGAAAGGGSIEGIAVANDSLNFSKILAMPQRYVSADENGQINISKPDGYSSFVQLSAFASIAELNEIYVEDGSLNDGDLLLVVNGAGDCTINAANASHDGLPFELQPGGPASRTFPIGGAMLLRYFEANPRWDVVFLITRETLISSAGENQIPKVNSDGSLGNSGFASPGSNYDAEINSSGGTFGIGDTNGDNNNTRIVGDDATQTIQIYAASGVTVNDEPLIGWTMAPDSGNIIGPTADKRGWWFRCTHNSPTFVLPASADCIPGVTRFRVQYVGSGTGMAVNADGSDRIEYPYEDSGFPTFQMSGPDFTLMKGPVAEIWYVGDGKWTVVGGPVANI